MCDKDKRDAKVRRGSANVIAKVIKKALLGIRLQVDQYDITGRQLEFSYPTLKNAAAKAASNFNSLSKKDPNNSNAYRALAKKNKFELKKHEADLTTTKAIKFHKIWSLLDKAIAEVNDDFGQSVGLHIARSKTFEVTESGNFKCKNLAKAPKTSVDATEKMCAKIFPYVKLVAEDVASIYPIVDGIVEFTAISEKEYNSRKRIEKNVYSDSECGSMPLIPGVLQIHILIELLDSDFKMTEVYCDGDCIFPEI